MSDAREDLGRRLQADRAEHDHQEPVHHGEQEARCVPPRGHQGGQSHVQVGWGGGGPCHQQGRPGTSPTGTLAFYVLPRFTRFPLSPGIRPLQGDQLFTKAAQQNGGGIGGLCQKGEDVTSHCNALGRNEDLVLKIHDLEI